MSIVSIILPCFNHEKYISQCIKSILTQSYKDFELIIIDDCSDDGSRDIIDEYLNKDDRIVAIFNNENKGPGSSRNSGIEISRGDFIAFCDSDDVWERDKIETQLSVFKGNNDYDVVHSDAYIINENGNRTGQKFSELYQKNMRLNGAIFYDLCKTNFINTQTVMMKKKCINSAGLFPIENRVAEDWVYWVKIAKSHNFFYIARPLANYRIHDKNTNTDSLSYTMNRIKAINSILFSNPDLPKKIRSELLYHLAVQHFEMQEYDTGKKIILESLKCYRFNLKSLLRYLVKGKMVKLRAF
jgi:glycosyltransferase involved in cell wall biosynthesis